MATEIYVGALPGKEFEVKALKTGISIVFWSDELPNVQQTVAFSVPTPPFDLWEEFRGKETCIYIGKNYVPLYRICFHHNEPLHHEVLKVLQEKGGVLP